MDGGIGRTIQVRIPNGTAAGRLKLRDGQVLTIRVGRYLAHRRYEVTIRGTKLVVKSTVALPAGSSLPARVVTTGRRVELKIASFPETQTGPIATRAPQSEVAALAPRIPAQMLSLLVQSMRRSGLPITPESIAAVSSMIPRSRRKDPSFIRFATIFFDKQLHVDPQRLEELYLTVEGGGRDASQSGTDQKGRGRDSREGRDWEESIPDRGAGAHRQIDSEADERERAANGGVRLSAGASSASLRAQLGSQLLAREGAAADWYTLFNHRRGVHETWIIVPFRVGPENLLLEGSIRLRLDLQPPRSSSRGAILGVSRAAIVVNGVASFEVTGSPPARLKIYADSVPTRTEITRLLPVLGEKLRNLGVETDDIINGGAEFDGFTAETFRTPGVDATA